MARRITDLAELSARQKEALLAAHIESVEWAEDLGRDLVAHWLHRVRPVLTAQEIDEVLRVLFP